MNIQLINEVIIMKTLGHWQDNGGLRGHSTGDFYPWRIMAKGTFRDLKWFVISPTGKELAEYFTPYGASIHAQIEFDKSRGINQ